jgi:hypothetical protein
MRRTTKVVASCALIVMGLAACTMAQTTAPPFPPPSVSDSGLPLLVDGTAVKLRTTSPLSSSDARVGQSVEFEVIDEVRVGNVIVIPKSSAAFATVTAAQSKHSAAKAGKLEVSIDYVRLGNGDKAALRATAATSQSADPAAAASSRIVINPLSASGKDVNVARGTEISACVSGSVPIDPRKFGQVGGAMIPIPESVSSKGVTELSITSAPDGAEIAVDEKLVGVTPLRVIVPPGEHVIALRLAGYAAWVRSLQAAGGKMNLAATLDRGGNAEIQYNSTVSPAACAVANGCSESALAAASRAAKAHRAQQKGGQPDSSPQH